MISNLKISNYALIRNLDIDFEPGMNTITGETGAGKSIMLGALGLILGNRADTGALMDDKNKCIIEGSFNIDKKHLKPLFDQHDLDFDKETIIRREITPSGKSRAFINDTPVNVRLLKDFGSRLVDIHSQHQTIRLTDPAFRMALVDAFSGQTENARSYKEQYAQWQQKKKKLEELKQKAAQFQRDKDYYAFQVQEIEKLNIEPEDYPALEEEYNLLDNAESIKLALEKSVHELSEGDDNLSARLGSILQELTSSAESHHELKNLINRLESAKIEIDDIASGLQQFNAGFEMDEQRKETLRETIDQVNALLRKHQLAGMRELTEYKASIEEKLSKIEDAGSETESLEKETEALEETLKKNADELHLEREKALKGLNSSIEALLKSLGIQDARVNLQLKKQEALNAYGWDALEFLFSANQGTELKSVQQAASGGELSRLMLSLKYLLAHQFFLPTIVFDEIDSGISGEVAFKVGELIKHLSESKQIICVTHQPQIAAMGIKHFTVFKKRSAGNVETMIESLQADERIHEVARMIGGDKPSDSALANARELINKS